MGLVDSLKNFNTRMKKRKEMMSKITKPQVVIMRDKVGGFGGMKQSLHARPPPILHSMVL